MLRERGKGSLLLVGVRVVEASVSVLLLPKTALVPVLLSGTDAPTDLAGIIDACRSTKAPSATATVTVNGRSTLATHPLVRARDTPHMAGPIRTR